MAGVGGFNLKGLDGKAKKALQDSLVLVGNEAKNHFKKSFRDQGFDDNGIVKWQPRKDRKRDTGRAILTKSGDLNRSIRIDRINRSNLSLVLATDLKYAAVNNYGLRAGRKPGFLMPKRQFIGDSYNLNEKAKKVIINKINSIFK